MKPRTERTAKICRLLLSAVVILTFIFDTLPLKNGFAKALSSNPGSIQGDVIFVNYAAHGKNNGSSWMDAFTEFQSALDLAQSSDEIWIAGGTYWPSLPPNAADPRSATFDLIDGVKLYGGFAGDENSLDERKWMENPTILSGDIDHNDLASPVTNVEQIQGDNAFHVVTSIGMGQGLWSMGLRLQPEKQISWRIQLRAAAINAVVECG
jgi:hypothetical protein